MQKLFAAATRRIRAALPTLAPPHRRNWSEAMQREIDAAPDAAAALRYALGCLWVVAREGAVRLGSPAFAVQASLTAFTSGLSMVAVFTCGRMLLVGIHDDHRALLAAGSAVGALGLLYGLAAERLIRRRPRGLMVLAGAVILLAAGAALTVNPTNDRFLHALSLETLGTWAFVVTGALGSQLLTRHPSQDV